MSTKAMKRTIVLIATVVTLWATAFAQQNQTQNQNQNQNQQQNQQAQQNQQPQQNQPAQQPQKKGFWQKVHDFSQAGQNVMQQGSNTVQQGRGAVQQTGQQVQGTIQQTGQQVQGGVQQMQGGVQQVPNGMQQATDGSQGMANGFQGSGGGAGACGPSCFDAGPFQANVSQMTVSQEGYWHIIRMNIQFHNATNQPLVIAYHDGSMVMVDNNGNTYVPAGGNPGQLQGMGIDRGSQTDSQFQLGPGQTGYALFSVARSRAANSPVGTGYSYNFTIDELQLQNGALAIPVRTYNLNFPSLAPGTSSASFGSGASPATGVVANGKGANTAGGVASQGTAQRGVLTQPGQAQIGAATGKSAVVGGAVGAAAQPQQRMINGRPMVATPAQATAASTVNNAAIKTAVPAAMKAPVAAPVRAQAAPPAAAKPAAATPAVKPVPAAAPKKAANTTNPTK